MELEARIVGLKINTKSRLTFDWQDIEDVDQFVNLGDVVFADSETELDVARRNNIDRSAFAGVQLPAVGKKWRRIRGWL